MAALLGNPPNEGMDARGASAESTPGLTFWAVAGSLPPLFRCCRVQAFLAPPHKPTGLFCEPARREGISGGLYIPIGARSGDAVESTSHPLSRHGPHRFHNFGASPLGRTERKLFFWDDRTVGAGVGKSQHCRVLKEMNFHFAHRSSSPIWPGSQSVSNRAVFGRPHPTVLLRTQRSTAGDESGS